MMRRLAAILALSGLPGLAAAQPLTPCEVIEAPSAGPGIVTARDYAVAIEDRSARRIVLTFANGQRSSTELTPMGGGVSVRLIANPDPRDASRLTLVFNRAALAADGTLSVETWIRRPGAAAPTHVSYRLRCVAGGATK